MIKQVIEYLNEKEDYSITYGQYYDESISLWNKWYKGYVPKFHKYEVVNFNKKRINKTLKTLKMGKLVPESWADLLVNDDLSVEVETNHKEKLKDALQEQLAMILEDNKFNVKMGHFIEKVYALGSGVAVNRSYAVEYYDATQIIPISSFNDDVTECAVFSQSNENGTNYLILEIEKIIKQRDGMSKKELENVGKYSYRTIKLEVNTDSKQLTYKEDFRDEITSTFRLFTFVKPNLASNIDNSFGMGLSIFSSAIDQLEGVDKAYDLLMDDVDLSKKMIIMDEDLFQIDTDEAGNKYAVSPMDLEQRLFKNKGNIQDGKGHFIHEYNPLIRIEENEKTINALLSRLSFNCKLGNSFFTYDPVRQGTKTATEVKLQSKELVVSVVKQRGEITDALKNIVTNMLKMYILAENEKINPKDFRVKISYSDSLFRNIDEEKKVMMSEVAGGLTPKYEYRMKFKGETEEEAKKIIAEVDDDLEDLIDDDIDKGG